MIKHFIVIIYEPKPNTCVAFHSFTLSLFNLWNNCGEEYLNTPASLFSVGCCWLSLFASHMVDGCSSRTETKQATDWIFRTLLPLPYTLMERYRTIVCGSKKNFKGGGGSKGLPSLPGGPRHFWGYLIFITFKRLCCCQILEFMF